MEKKEFIDKLTSLLSENKEFAYVLDYALNAKDHAYSDGGFKIQQEIIPSFKECLDKLKEENVVVDYKGQRYIGETQSFRIIAWENEVKTLLNDFYHKIETNASSTFEELATKYPLEISHIFEDIRKNDNVFFDVAEYRHEKEDICKDLVKNGLMFSWNWITKKHTYNCYRLRRSPFNAYTIFTKVVEESLGEIIKSKIDEYVRDKKACRLNFLLAHSKYGYSSEREEEMRNNGWSEKAITEVKYSLEKESMLFSDSSPLSPKLRELLLEKKDRINELIIEKSQELNKLNLSLTKEGLLKKKEFVDIEDVIDLLEKSVNTIIKDGNIEVLNISKREKSEEVIFVCNKQVYRIAISDSHSYSVSIPSYDKEILIWNKIPLECVNDFLSKKEVRERLFVIGYGDSSILGFGDDPIVNLLVENLRSNGIPLRFPAEKVLNYYENIRAPPPINEEFVYIQPYDPKAIEGKILVLFEQASDTVMILNPYPDKNTFFYLRRLKPNVKVQLVIKATSEDLKNSKKINTHLVEKTVGDKNIQTKRNKYLHSRLFILDNKKAFLSSFDVQEKGMEERYQYGLLTDNSKIVEDIIKYFKLIWDASESQNVNLKEELKG